MTDTSSENLRLWGITEETSVLAQAAFDYLKAGQTIFGLDDGWQHLRDVPDGLTALVAFLRSDEPMPDAIRIALADALDPALDSPIKLKPIKKKQASIVTVLNQIQKADPLLDSYDKYRSMGKDHLSAKMQSAIDHTTNQSDAGQMLADARANRELSATVGTAMNAKRPITEIYEIMTQRDAKPRKRGPKKSSAQ